MLDISHRIWLKDGDFVQLFGDEVVAFANLLEDKLGSEAREAFLDIVALVREETESSCYDEEY